MFLEQLRSEQMVGAYHLTPSVSLVPGVNLLADLTVESKDYKVGLKDTAISAAGKIIYPAAPIWDDIFHPMTKSLARSALSLDDVAWDFSGGYAWHEGKTTLSYMRRAPTAENVYRVEYDFGPKWRLRYEYWRGSNVKEYAIRYRIHEFLSGEYVYSTNKSYFRIVGNL